MSIAEKDIRFLKSLTGNSGFIGEKNPDFLKEKLFEIKITMLLWTRNEHTKDLLRREIFHLYDNLSDDEIIHLYRTETLRVMALMLMVNIFLPH